MKDENKLTASFSEHIPNIRTVAPPYYFYQYHEKKPFYYLDIRNPLDPPKMIDIGFNNSDIEKIFLSNDPDVAII